MNFVIHISAERPIGTVKTLDVEGRGGLTTAASGAELHYLEVRRDPRTAEQFVALVYKVPEEA